MVTVPARSTRNRYCDRPCPPSVPFDCCDSVLDVQFTPATIVVEPVGDVRGLLRLHKHHAAADRVYGSGCNIEHVAWPDVDPVQQLFRTVLADGGFELVQCDPGLESERNLRVRSCLQHIPALGLAAGLSDPLRAHVVGMHLNRKLLCREQKLHQQRKTVLVNRSRSHEIPAILSGHLTQGAASKRTIGDATGPPSQPAFTNRLIHDFRVDRSEVSYPPRTFVENRDQQEWVEVRHEWKNSCAYFINSVSTGRPLRAGTRTSVIPTVSCVVTRCRRFAAQTDVALAPGA